MHLSRVLIAALLLGAGCSSGPGGQAPTSPSPVPTTAPAPAAASPSQPPFAGVTTARDIWTSTDAPVGAALTGVTWWAKSGRPDGSSQIAAIFQPGGTGPFPVVLYFHSAEGLIARSIGETLASSGYLVVIGCHTRAAFGCRQVPADGPEALVDLARALPSAGKGQVGLAGESLGATLAESLAARRDDVAAVIADSGTSAGSFPKAPVLILESVNDDGSLLAAARTYESARRERGLPVEAQYYEKGGHIVLGSPDTRDDATRRMVAFLARFVSAR
jgi:dienelactone hydrolase